MNTHQCISTHTYFCIRYILKHWILQLWRWTSSKTFRMMWQWDISGPCFDLDLKAETCRTWGEPQPGSSQAQVCFSLKRDGQPFSANQAFSLLGEAYLHSEL